MTFLKRTDKNKFILKDHQNKMSKYLNIVTLKT